MTKTSHTPSIRQAASGRGVEGDAGQTEAELLAELTAAQRRISELTAAATDLRESERRYRNLYDEIPLIYLTTDREGIILSVNAHGARELRYEPDELVHRSILDLVAEEDRTEVEAKLRAFAANPGSPMSWEARKLRKDRTPLWASDTIQASRQANGRLGFLVISEDITERKLSERQILDYQERLKSLAAAVVLAEERERRRIGAGLHDDVGQTLAIVKIKLGELYQSAAGSGSARELGEIRDLLDQAIRSTRTLNFELSPPVLYELGLAAALQELGERMERRGDLRFQFSADRWRDPSAELAIVLYRSVRELLFNVVKHAQASHVRMAIGASSEEVRIVIEDDGVGFAGAGQVFDASGGFGLFTVREQLIHIGGRLEIDSSPGEGTRVRLFAPSMP
jgi:PAS domain S-box-containing protein